MNTIIEVKNLTKSTFVVDVSVKFEKGKIHCIVGPNGSGKTTLLRLILGLLKPDKGEVRVMGFNPWKSRKFLAYTGVSMDHFRFPRNVNVKEYLIHVARLKGSDFSEINELDEILNFSPEFNKPLEYLSAGFKKKVSLAQALMGSPELIILDEPTVNLERGTREKLLEEIYRRSREGVTFLIASHEFHEMEKIADDVHLMSQGRVLLSENLSRIKERLRVLITGQDVGDIPNVVKKKMKSKIIIIGPYDDLKNIGSNLQLPSLNDIYDYIISGGLTNEKVFRTYEI